MSTDRELLELAARAAGIDAPYDEKWGGMLLPVTIHEPDDGYAFWNPLTDDGDALRLAVKLHMVIECIDGQSAARTFDGHFAGCVDHAHERRYPNREFDPDPYAATRRAIVRAAAEIGKHSAPSKEES